MKHKAHGFKNNINICSRDVTVGLEREDKIVNIDNNYMDLQLCATYACDIYKHLPSSEAKKRPSTDFMERIQKDINSSMRAILIDGLVEVAEEYWLLPETLYLRNYIDRYLSGNAMNRQKLQLLGVNAKQLECLTNYIAELSLLEYSMLCYAPSLIAASAIFWPNLYFSLQRNHGPGDPPLEEVVERLISEKSKADYADLEEIDGNLKTEL
ncbi:hypothetical protein RIF29_21522 [Crotalaria pallida]|uniref:B-like cyclin n=1 Tax=Crotalaria pallida TaxID=3830 RepID=A0AAN9F7H6_CROPI